MKNTHLLKLFVITAEHIFDGEADILNALFAQGMETLHLRKPQATQEELSALLSGIDSRYHDRIVLHDHFGLLHSFRLRGVHLNSRNPEPPASTASLTISRSCHSLEELRQIDDYDYVFLSPIFDSLSKLGYTHAFTPQALQAAKEQGLINDKVIALGGIQAGTIPAAASYAFGGVAVLGALWAADYRPPVLFISHATDRYDHLASIDLALQGGCRHIQLRMKDAPDSVVEETANLALRHCFAFGGWLYINDHPHIAQRVRAHGVHLGKTDMSPQEARQLLGDTYCIGGTANTFDDILRLSAEGVDYIGLGPYRFTHTKQGLAPLLGLEGYSRILDQCRQAGIHLPICAIGGITADDVAPLFHTGITGIALSSSVLQAPDPLAAMQRITRLATQHATLYRYDTLDNCRKQL